MALQCKIEEPTRSLVDLSYQSSDKDVGVDSTTSTGDVAGLNSEDDDISNTGRLAHNPGVSATIWT